MPKIESSEDFAAVRKNWAQGKARPAINNRSNVEHIEFEGQDIAVLLSGEDTAGQMAICEVAAQPGSGATNHHQTSEEEYWYILEGDWEVKTGEKAQTVGPGDMVLIPRMTTHAFRLISDKPGKMLTIHAPAGHELFFKDLERNIKAKTPPEELFPGLARFNVVFEEIPS